MTGSVPNGMKPALHPRFGELTTTTSDPFYP